MHIMSFSLVRIVFPALQLHFISASDINLVYFPVITIIILQSLCIVATHTINTLYIVIYLNFNSVPALAIHELQEEAGGSFKLNNIIVWCCEL